MELAWEERNNFEFFWTTFDRNLEQTVVNLVIDPPCTLQEDSQCNFQYMLSQNMKCLRHQGCSTVLIIDNFDLPPEQMNEVLHSEIFGSLLNLDMKVIFTCRHRPPHWVACLEVLPMSKDELLRLMNCYYQVEDYSNSLPQIIEVAQYNTLVVEQAAKILDKSWGELTPE